MAKGAARKVLVVRFVRGGEPNLEGATRSFVRTDKHGVTMAYSVVEDEAGVILTKGEAVTRIPWARILQVEYVDG